MRCICLLSALVVMVSATPGLRAIIGCTSCPVEAHQERVCGSDNMIYNNMCALKLKQCEDPSVTLLDAIDCTSLLHQRECQLSCTQNEPFTFLCGSDGMRYSACELNAKWCNEPDFEVRECTRKGRETKDEIMMDKISKLVME
ncbi:uncharacterized protein LOC123507058 [Portunus trituberculatus]|uniref:uncharacterized protein LOC123507058 n=1 Tax=Portunus trituberculatus TaxID=210409 RepID=UPI001E1CDB32|nr:uncharacterized protein LOC123507058 [Portunus trituberculatus]